MAASHSDSEVQRLAAHNQALSEELTQCQTDKEFVWSLWKRLQVANPDISQAISMVVQREKEKAELKDRKVLEILHSKDDRIAYLEQLVAEQERRLAEISERVGDASIDRKEELAALHVHHEQQTSEAEKKEKEEAARIQALLDEKEKVLSELKAEKDDLKHEVERLQATVDESQAALSKMQELNGQYESKVQDLQVGLEDVVQKARLASKELDSKTEGLERTKTRLQELTVELKNSGQDLHRTRLEYEDMKAQHDQAIHQAAQQAQLIQQLQALQADTHKVLKNQESAHTMESTNFQKMYHELRIRFEKLVHSEKELRLRLVESQGQVTAKPPMRSVSLQVNLKDNSGQRSRSRSREVTRVKHREERKWTTGIQERVSSESSPSPDQHAMRDRATSTPTKETARRRARSLSPSSGRHVAYQERDGVWNQGRISDFLDASQRRGGRDARKKEDLRKLLRLKNQEVDELRKAHGRRLERLRTLQSAYDVVKEQIKTYEQHESGKEKKKKRLPRSESKDLRREDSDGVWNELAYYKQQTTKLTQEMMNIEEEIDRLRVQAAVDASTIEDLTRCLEDEKNGLENQLARLQAADKREQREKARAEDLFDKNKRLERSLHILQSKQSEWNEERDKLERHLRSMRADLVQAKTISTHKEVEHHALVEEITKLKMKMKKLAVTMRREAERERQTSRAEDPIEDDLGPGVHVIVHEEEDDGDDDDSEADGDDDWDNEEDPDFYHSTPRKTSTRRSQSLSPGRTLSGCGPNAIGRSRTSSLHSTNLDGTSRTRSRNSNRSRSLGAISGSPSKRELMSVLHHLDRMAQAYQDSPPVFQTLLMSVATQTERVALAESAMMTESEGSDISGTSLSTEGAIFPGIHPISPISSRRDTATSPMKNLSYSGHTINRKTGTKSRGASPGPGGVNILKRRLGALQQQVASLQEQRKMLQKAAVEYKQSNEALQADLNLANARHQNSKITIQRLTHEVEDLKKEKDLLQIENQDLTKQKTEKHSDAEWKSSETRLKSQASEIVRQGSIIKAMKSEKEVLNETIKTLENKVHHLDRDLSQKRTLIDDLRSRTRSAITSDKAHAETVDMLENKILSLTETLDKRKVEIDSLRKRVAVVTKEKHHYEQQTFDLRNELDKKAAVLKDTLAKLSEADSALTEMETTASQQLQMLASQSETALDAAHTKIKQMQSRIRDLEAFIEDLAKEISSQAQTALDQALTKGSRTTTPGPDPEKDQSMIRAQSIASSILNMSTKDLEQFMEDEKEDQTQPVKRLASHDQDGAWQQQIKALLRSKKFSSKKLKDLMMEKLHTRDEALALARESR